jgi:hypothetical protein
MKKQLTSLLLAFTIAFPTSVLAQANTSSVEMKKASALLTITDGSCFLESQTTTNVISGAMGLSLGSLIYIAMSYWDKDPKQTSHRPLARLSDIELLGNSTRFEKYLEVWNGTYQYLQMTSKVDEGFVTPGPGGQVHNSFIHLRITGDTVKTTRPGRENPIIQGFKGVNAMMDAFTNVLEWRSAESQFVFQGLQSTTGPQLAFTRAQLHNVFKVLQYVPADQLKNYTEFLTLRNLDDAIRTFNPEFMEAAIKVIDPTMFRNQYSTLKRALSMIAQEHAPIDGHFVLKVYTSLSNAGLTPNDHFRTVQSRFHKTHERVIRTRKTGRIALKAGTGLMIGGVVATLVYLSMTDSAIANEQEPTILEKYNLTFEDSIEIMRSDSEQYKIILENEPAFRKDMAGLYDHLLSEIRTSKKMIGDFDRYVAENKI